MKLGSWHWLKTFPGLLATPRPDPAQQAERIVSVQRRIVLPVKIGIVALALYFLFSPSWTNAPLNTEMVVWQTLRGFYMVYIACNVIAAFIFFSWRRFPPGLFQWLVFVLGLLDGLFVVGLMLSTNGLESDAFWLLPLLIVLNAISIPLAMPQIVLNLSLCVFYVGVGILQASIGPGQIPLMDVPGPGPLHMPAGTNTVITTNIVVSTAHSATSEKPHRPTIIWDSTPPPPPEEAPTESFLSNLFVLLLLTFCCYGVQALAERQRRELEEAREFAMREGQLNSAGRLAAEFAHRIKNPLAIINNAAFSLQRSVRENKNSAAQQIEIIQEEVARADRVITQIMGYAQLSEGRLEKLDVFDELESAIRQVFPPAVFTEIQLCREYAEYFPPLFMQRGHLSEIFVNLLKNGREAITGPGKIFINADCLKDNSIQVSIRDTGAGIPPDKIIRIFEAYYTTKAGGTGLGLAIVKHNIELYGGTARVKSEVGKGAEFILTFPAKAIVNIRK